MVDEGRKREGSPPNPGLVARSEVQPGAGDEGAGGRGGGGRRAGAEREGQVSPRSGDGQILPGSPRHLLQLLPFPGDVWLRHHLLLHRRHFQTQRDQNGARRHHLPGPTWSNNIGSLSLFLDDHHFRLPDIFVYPFKAGL